MTKHTKEDLCRLIDGELDSAQASRVIDEITRDADLRTRWGRYHLMSDAMRDQLGPGAPADFAERVRGALDSEPPLAPPRRRASPAKAVAGLALAASVAALAILGVNVLRSDRTAPPPSVVAQGPPAESGSLRWDVAEPTVETRLNGYLVSHSEYLGNGMRGLLPYARIVGYEGREDAPAE